MKDIDGFPCGGRVDVLEKRALKSMYGAVSRALEDPKKVYGNTPRAFQEGLNTAKVMLSKVRGGTRRQIEKELIEPRIQNYINKNSFG
jgi:hypothetical protein